MYYLVLLKSRMILESHRTLNSDAFPILDTNNTYLNFILYFKFAYKRESDPNIFIFLFEAAYSQLSNSMVS